MRRVERAKRGISIRSLVVATGLVGAGLGGTLPVLGRTAGDRVGQTPSAERVAMPLCAGGMQSEVDLRVEPIAVHVTNGADELVLRIHVGDRFSEKGDWKMRYTVETVDDVGGEVQPTTVSDRQDVAGGGAFHTDMRPSPKADGFYRATVTVVARKQGVNADNQTTFYWQVSKGRVIPMEAADWFRESPRAGRAVQL